MTIEEIAWDDEQIDHIERHGVTSEEVEEVCFSRPLIVRGRGRRKRRSYWALGQTGEGRHLLVVFRYLSRGKARVITARDMSPAERRRYRRAT